MTPLTQTKLLSFKDNFKELVNLSLRNKLPNKLIFSGNKGIGKSTFAFHLINYLFSQDEEGSYNLEDNNTIEVRMDNMLIHSGNSMNINGKIINLSPGRYTKPKLFNYKDLLYISITDEKENKIYLYNN